MVARPGANMPAPFAIPPTVKPPTEISTVLGTESVVMIAVAAANPAVGDSCCTAASIPASNESIGSRRPISPVEATAMRVAGATSCSLRCSAVDTVSE